MSPAQARACKIICDLVQIHRQRIEHYQDALTTSARSCPDVKAMFADIIRQSSQYQQELTDCLSQLNEGLEKSPVKNNRKGNVYSTWTKTKTAISGGDHKSILESCQAEGEAVLYAYIAALSISESVQAGIRRLIEAQFYGIRSTLDSIEEYHDAL
jgi:uncharacterized protein (TIGR02284 family)